MPETYEGTVAKYRRGNDALAAIIEGVRHAERKFLSAKDIEALAALNRMAEIVDQPRHVEQDRDAALARLFDGEQRVILFGLGGKSAVTVQRCLARLL